ncbi:CRISPR type I-E-associated protein CasB/Cse2 [Brevibacterium sanguinis]|uniref:CRISPR type I-E-associated protein CasB/Cse2 n=2 Tax=Brevibacterium TaxID=1696 RepID=A0A366IJ98_9MICO|nr:MULTISPECIES: type I-E CRISPR-associated protein Cse2/CasB [Brevibacterium]RBP65566.1 CRISPR type I-E-associated protein CasB/Cse2 [Brevibacterium sanguinis]RBP72200.1 CRISPR type I-E-associated protein CasB/Cse2 [Brevibacterium celere]
MPDDSTRTDTRLTPSSFVIPKVRILQEGHEKDRAAARSVLAQLRRASAGDPGTAWEISEYLLPEREYFDSAMRPGSPRSESADYLETAIHVAMTTYAQLQQGKDSGMHVKDRTLGEAARMLAAHRDEPMDRGKVWERLAKLAQSQTMSSLRWQLRGFVGLLHRRSIGLDIGRLADDVFYWQFPASRPNVQRSWSRQFFHNPRPEADATATDSTT